jgi:hypothetical protein
MVLKKTGNYSLFLILILVVSCIDNDALRGRITVRLTDAPSDNTEIKKVNISIKRVEILPENSEKWTTIKSFEEPITLDLLEYTGGEFYDLTEQYTSPGKYVGIRLELNVANVSNGLTVFPQSNLILSDGSQKVLTISNTGQGNYVEALGEFELSINQALFLTLDFDVRKSIAKTETGYFLRPAMRFVRTIESGGIEGFFRDFANHPRTIVYAYRSGVFSSSELTTEPVFTQSITSSGIKNSEGGKFYLAYLPVDVYDLVFVEINADGSTKAVLGKLSNVTVIATEDITICGRVTVPPVPGSCLQLEPAL